jgi:hypothetical protein
MAVIGRSCRNCLSSNTANHYHTPVKRRPPGSSRGLFRHPAVVGSYQVCDLVIWEDAMKSLAALTFVALTLAFAPSASAASRRIVVAQASPPEVCTQVHQPVCGTDPSGKRTTYSNACFARIAKATDVSPGECPK